MKRAAVKKSDGRISRGPFITGRHHPSLPAGNLYLHPWLIWRHPVPELDHDHDDEHDYWCRESRDVSHNESVGN